MKLFRHLLTSKFKGLILALSICASLFASSYAFPFSDATVINSSSPIPSLFPNTVYRTAEHVHSIDEASVSNYYYSKFVKGYDSLYFAYQSGYLTGTPIDDPSFEANKIPSSDWSSTKSGTFSSGYPKISASSAQKASGSYSLHLASKSSGSTFSYAGVEQDPTHKKPLAAGLSFSYKIFPVKLSDTTSSADSEIQIKFRLLYRDSGTVFPSITYVLRDDQTESSIGFNNSTSDLYIIHKNFKYNQWNSFTVNLASAAKSYWGTSFMNDQAVDDVQIRVYTRNGGTVEMYFDSLSQQVTKSNADVYSIQAGQLSSLSTTSMRLIEGEELNGDANIFGLGIPSSKFFESASGSSGPATDISVLHSKGLYAGVAHPFQTTSQLEKVLLSNYDADMMDIYGNQGSVYLTDTTAWDEYLTDGIAVMATATPNVHSPSGVNRMNSEAFAIYTYSDSSNTNSILEKIAMGRSYIASVKVGGGSLNNTPMNLYFAALGDKVPMGRYPIIVDSQTDKTGKLHAALTNVPSNANYKMVLKTNGGDTVGSSISIPSGTSLFEHEYNLSLGSMPNGSFKYFRYEVQDSQGKPVAFSQPIIYQKISSAIYPGFWTALVPKATAALDLPANSVTFSAGTLSQKVEARLVQGQGQVATVKTYVPKGMFGIDSFDVSIDSAGSGLTWQFSASTRILTSNFTVLGSSDVTLKIQHST